uniref:hypothetical protein n=1 Tax=Salmonella sp. s55004 TaxID=3159675 RepID=UPI00397F76F9
GTYPILQCYGCEIDHPSQTQHPCLMDDVVYDDVTWLNIVKQFPTEMALRSYGKAIDILHLNGRDLLFFDSMLAQLLDAWKNSTWWNESSQSDEP